MEAVINGKGKADLSSIRKEIPILNKSKSIADLFEILVDKKSHIAMIADDFGNTVGLVTVEDILETLLGMEIMDESDTVEDMQIFAKEEWKRRRGK